MTQIGQQYPASKNLPRFKPLLFKNERGKWSVFYPRNGSIVLTNVAVSWAAKSNKVHGVRLIAG